MNNPDSDTVFGVSLLCSGLLCGVLYSVFEPCLMAVLGLFQIGIGILHRWAEGVLPQASTAG